MQKALEGNIWKYTLILVANKRIFAAILSVYYLTIPDVTATWIGIFLLIGSMTGFIFEVPSGYFSDRIGHKNALIISRVATLLSTLFFLLADSIPFLIIGTIFLSIGGAFISGTGSAFMHETLRALGREHEYTKVMGKVSSVGFAVPILLTALIPFFVEVSYKIPFMIALCIDLVGVWAATTLTKPKITQEEIDEIGLSNFSTVLHEGARLNFFRYALFSGILFGLLYNVGVFRGPFQMELGVAVVWFGILHGIGRVGASILLAFSGRLKTWIGSIHRFQTFQILVYALFFIVIGFVPVWWVIVSAFMVLNAVYWGTSKIDEGFLLEIIQRSKFKATLLSLKSLIGEVSTAISALMFGYLIDLYGSAIGLFFPGFAFLCVLLVLHLWIVRTASHVMLHRAS